MSYSVHKFIDIPSCMQHPGTPRSSLPLDAFGSAIFSSDRKRCQYLTMQLVSSKPTASSNAMRQSTQRDDLDQGGYNMLCLRIGFSPSVIHLLLAQTGGRSNSGPRTRGNL